MRRLIGVLAVLALTILAALPSEAGGWVPGVYYCERALDCPDFLDCWVTGCVNNTCEYTCW